MEEFGDPLHGPSFGVVSALLAFGDTATDYLTSCLDTAGAEARAVATRMLVAMGHVEALPAITGLLADPDNRVRAAAAEGLVSVGRLAVEPLVLALTVDPNEMLPDPAADCLAEIGVDATDRLVLAASDLEAPRRHMAVEVLARIGAPDIGLEFVEWLSDSDEAVRIASARGLQQVEYEAALPNLLDGIDDETQACQEARLAALCSFGEAAVPVLIEKMSDPTWSESPALAKALAALGELVEDAIVELLDDEEPRRRVLAARTLQDMRLEAAAERLRDHVRDEDLDVRREVALALASLSPAASEPLLPHLGEDDAELRALYVETRSTRASDAPGRLQGYCSTPG